MSKQKTKDPEVMDRGPGPVQGLEDLGTHLKEYQESGVALTSAGSRGVAVRDVDPELQARIDDVQTNMESIENFKIPRAKMSASGWIFAEGETAVTELEGAIIHTARHNVYYEKMFNNKAPPTQPDCFSIDGIQPHPDLQKVEHPTCKGCPKAEFKTNARGTGKACRNLKPIFMLLGDDSIMPMQVTVTPASLKAADTYLTMLTARGVSYRKIRTIVEAYKAQPEDTFMTLRFKMGRKLNEQESGNVEYLRSIWMSRMKVQTIETEIATES